MPSIRQRDFHRLRHLFQSSINHAFWINNTRKVRNKEQWECIFQTYAGAPSHTYTDFQETYNGQGNYFNQLKNLFPATIPKGDYIILGWDEDTPSSKPKSNKLPSPKATLFYYQNKRNFKKVLQDLVQRFPYIQKSGISRDFFIASIGRLTEDFIFKLLHPRAITAIEMDLDPSTPAGIINDLREDRGLERIQFPPDEDPFPSKDQIKLEKALGNLSDEEFERLAKKRQG